MCTAVLPLYLAAVGLGPAALGLVEGVADFLVSVSKLAGGVVGQYLRRKRPAASAGYLITGLATGGIGLVHGLGGVLLLRATAWVARGYRGPLRDYLMAEAVEPRYYGRAYGLERAGDMLGAVGGPLLAAALLGAGLGLSPIILWTTIPGVLAAGAMFFLTRGVESHPAARPSEDRPETGPAIPAVFWAFLLGVLLFGMGDFSRTFLILLAARALSGAHPSAGAFSTAVLLYAFHNLISAAAAYPVGHLGDRRGKLRVLVAGYGIGVATNVLLAAAAGSIAWLVAAIALSGVYLAVEETLEKAAAADWLPRERRSLGFGILAGTNAVGDMASSLYVGFLLQADRPALAFGTAAAVGAVGLAWLVGVSAWGRRRRSAPAAG